LTIKKKAKYFDYLKLDADIRGYIPVFHEDNITGRFAVGIGAPFLNSTILPFEKRFYVGGANSVRAWRARDLGPGSFATPSGTIYDKSGDLKIEGSLEYRFPVYGPLKSALFADIGNVWLEKKDSLRPGAEFSSKFIKEFAIGAGVGFRLDFSFFVFRFDFAVPLRDPSLPDKNRWLTKNYKSIPDVINKVNLNIGIGYPF
jgi:outer membrane protein insertion porin family